MFQIPSPIEFQVFGITQVYISRCFSIPGVDQPFAQDTEHYEGFDLIPLV
jgi:hypothetical protein